MALHSAPARRRMVEAPGTAPGSERLFHAAFIAIVGCPTLVNIDMSWELFEGERSGVIARWQHLPADQKVAGSAGQGPCPLSGQRAEIDAASARPAQPTRAPPFAGARGDPLSGAAGAGSRLRPRRRLHGRRCRHRAGGARVLRPRHQAGQRGSRADPLSDAPSPHDAVRDVRDQVPRQAADLRGAPVDPPSHRQRERILGALFDPRQRVLPSRRPSISQRSQRPTDRAAVPCWPARRRRACSACCARTPSWSTSTTRRC